MKYFLNLKTKTLHVHPFGFHITHIITTIICFQVYKLTVLASEMSTQPLMSTVQVIIEVLNVNDNPPVFREQEYRSQSISENVPIGSTVMIVSATDCDCSQTCQCAGGDLTYVLQKYTDTFSIDDVTGEIKTIKELDYDQISEYRFQVKVYDTDVRPQTGVADVVVTLSNVNDNAPKFTPDSGEYSITENIERGTILLTVQAQVCNVHILPNGVCAINSTS